MPVRLVELLLQHKKPHWSAIAVALVATMVRPIPYVIAAYLYVNGLR